MIRRARCEPRNLMGFKASSFPPDRREPFPLLRWRRKGRQRLLLNPDNPVHLLPRSSNVFTGEEPNAGKPKPHLQPALGPPVLMSAQPRGPCAASRAALWFPPTPDGAPAARSPIHYAKWEQPESQTLGQQIFVGGKKTEKEQVWLFVDTLPATRNCGKPQWC